MNVHNPQTADWIPAESGLVDVDVYGFTLDVPFDYTVKIEE